MTDSAPRMTETWLTCFGVVIGFRERFCRLNVGQEETEINLCFRKVKNTSCYELHLAPVATPIVNMHNF